MKLKVTHTHGCTCNVHTAVVLRSATSSVVDQFQFWNVYWKKRIPSNNLVSMLFWTRCFKKEMLLNVVFVGKISHNMASSSSVIQLFASCRLSFWGKWQKNSRRNKEQSNKALYWNPPFIALKSRLQVFAMTPLCVNTMSCWPIAEYPLKNLHPGDEILDNGCLHKSSQSSWSDQIHFVFNDILEFVFNGIL